MRIRHTELSPQRLAKSKAQLFCIIGDDHHLIKQTSELIVQKLTQSKTVEPQDVEKYSAGESDAETICSAVQTAPFLSSKRIVLVDDADQLRAAEVKKLLIAFDHMPPHNFVVLSCRESAAPPESLLQKVDADGVVIVCEKPRTSSTEFYEWVVQRARQLGKKMSTTVAGELRLRAGTDLERLAREIEKLATYVGARDTITKRDVASVCSESPEASVFMLVDAVAKRAPALAMRTLRSVRQQNMAPQMILAQLARQFRLMLQVRFLIDSGYRLARRVDLPEEMARRLPTEHNLLSLLQRQSWLAARLTQQTSAFATDDITSALTLIYKTDLATKGIEDAAITDEWLALELLVWKLCRLGQHRRRHRIP